MTSGSSDVDASTAAPFGSLPSPLDAVDDIRTAAKWMIAAAGAVATTLLGGGPLVAIGKVHGLGDAVIAGVSLVVALTGVGLAIWYTSEVLIPPLTTPATLYEPAMSELKKTIDSAPGDFFGVVASGIDDLLRHRSIALKLSQMMAAETDPARKDMLRNQLDRVLANAARADPYVRWLVATAHVWQVREKLRRARRYTLAGGVLVAAAAAAFFTVTGQPDTTYVPVVTPQITVLPTPGAS